MPTPVCNLLPRIAPLFFAGRYTHDAIALSGFGFDADSVRATKDRPSVSFEAMGAIVEAALALSVDPLSMLVVFGEAVRAGSIPSRQL